MDYVGIDLHKVHTQICIEDAQGNVINEMRVRSLRAPLEEVFGARPRAKILLESSGSSEWIAELLESLGHEVIVADPSYVLMYGTVSRRVKTDARDARALADACRMGAYRVAHRTSATQRRTRRKLVARDTLVKARTRLLTMCQGVLRQFGINVPTGAAESFSKRLSKASIPEDVREDFEPILGSLEAINAAIARCEEALEELAENDPAAKLLQSLPGVGPVTALGFVSRIDNPDRFGEAGQVGSYFGLVPSEHSSGERRLQGRITKTGDKYVRTLMIQLAIRMIRLKPPAAAPLWLWAQRVEARRGKNIARVALARRLTRVLFAMMKRKEAYSPLKLASAA